MATLYIPLSKQFSCDAITVSAHPACVVVLWECGVTDPRDPDRVRKVLLWFAPDGIISMLRRSLPTYAIVCALCWDGDIVAGKQTSYKQLDVAAASASLALGLRDLGVKV